MPALAIAAAAWSCVLKMLQLAQRTEAPSSTRVSMRTAVSIVMCSEPVTRTPLRGHLPPDYRLEYRAAGGSRHYVYGHVRYRACRMVVEQQVLAARRTARQRPNGEL